MVKRNLAGNRLAELVINYYSLAWLDRHLQGKLVFDAAGNVITYETVERQRPPGEDRAEDAGGDDGGRPLQTSLTGAAECNAAGVCNLGETEYERLRTFATPGFAVATIMKVATSS